MAFKDRDWIGGGRHTRKHEGPAQPEPRNVCGRKAGGRLETGIRGLTGPAVPNAIAGGGDGGACGKVTGFDLAGGGDVFHERLELCFAHAVGIGFHRTGRDGFVDVIGRQLGKSGELGRAATRSMAALTAIYEKRGAGRSSLLRCGRQVGQGDGQEHQWKKPITFHK